MSILIKGMEMPNRCADCPMCYDFISCQLEGKAFGEIDCLEIRADWCPLIELSPHGRLIDADALRYWGNHIGDEDEHRFHDAQWIYRDSIDAAPTIIEAEGKE